MNQSKDPSIRRLWQFAGENTWIEQPVLFEFPGRVEAYVGHFLAETAVEMVEGLGI